MRLSCANAHRHVRTGPRRPSRSTSRGLSGALPDQRIGEASALYLWSRTAAKHIAQVQPEAKIIAILREPASLLRSLHLQFVRELRRDGERLRARRSRSRAPDARVARSRATRTGRRRCCIPSTCATSSSCAATTTVFPPEQVLVLIYDDFRADNEATVRSVLRFLEVDDTAPIEVMEANPTRAACARSACTSWCTRCPSAAGPVSRGGEGGDQGAHADAAAARRSARDAARRRLRRAAARPTRRFMARAAPPLQGRGRRAQRVPGSRPGDPVGL